MPIYVYENINTGERVELIQKMGEAKSPKNHRRVYCVNIPSVVGDRAIEQKRFDKDMAHFADYEKRNGTLKTERDLKMKASEIKRIYKNPLKEKRIGGY